MHEDCTVDEILTITFTNKAANEMYSRIYKLLARRREDPKARDAIERFHQAQICTLDSFCAGVVRTASGRYGIRADFTSDERGVRELARETALRFVLDHRDDPALQQLIANRKIRTVADDLFAAPLLEHSPISRPLDFDGFIKLQGETILERWRLVSARADGLIREIRDTLAEATISGSDFYHKLKAALDRPLPAAPGIRPLLEAGGVLAPDSGADRGGAAEKARRDIAGYFEFLLTLISIDIPGRRPESHEPMIARLGELKKKNGLYAELEAAANYALQCGIAAGVFPLMKQFQEAFNREKRRAGILTFDDIACLAVDILSEHPDIRRVYKESFKKIMIDEFQDNNSLQRDLIYLLAEKPERRDPGIPQRTELCPDKMFFVGDEKQSIYRFRGADVSVFRRLARDLGNSLNLEHNYRSEPELISAFNRLFGGSNQAAGLFPRDAPDLPEYHASYHRVKSSRRPGPDPQPRPQPLPPSRPPPRPRVHFHFLDKGRLSEEDYLGSHDFEAVFIAMKIREMVKNKYQIYDRKTNALRDCRFSDFAVLERSYTHQNTLEKQFRNFNIPCGADRPAGLFSDAPINDLTALLRLLVYPMDRISYAALLRSPFARLSDLALPVCLLNESSPPFDEALEEQLPPEDRERYREARRRYLSLREDARSLSAAGLLTRLWYDEGYRYETLWSPEAQAYGELFDLFFELACEADSRGKSPADFLDYLEDIVNREARPDEKSLPPEAGPGVRIMSIHKSKGLEFPVVFIYGAGDPGRANANTGLTYYHERWGLTLNLPQAEEIPRRGGNYFYFIQKDEEQEKSAAELRRLLYVAMTRAESALYITAALPAQTRQEEKQSDPGITQYTEEFIRERLSQLAAKEGAPSSFLRLLVPVLAESEDPSFTIDPVYVFPRERLADLTANRRGAALSMEAAAKEAAPLYQRAAAPPPPVSLPAGIDASALRYAGAPTARALGEAPPAPPPIYRDRDRSRGIQGEFDFAGTGPAAAEPAAPPPSAKREGSPPAPPPSAKREGSPPDPVLDGTGLDAGDFGIIVHGFIEARLKGLSPRIPARFALEEKHAGAIRGAAELMADTFFASPLGKRSLAASFRETEFPIITMVKAGGRNIPLNGRIDLLFEWDNAIQVIDFKSGLDEEPARYLGQLAVYSRAVSDIFGKPVRPWIFFLRTGNAAELTEQIGQVDIEAMVQASL
jgi:ATP-dependent helicase/nuclease subunit A